MKDRTAEWRMVEDRANELADFFDTHTVPQRDRLPFAYYDLQAPNGSTPEWTLGSFNRGILTRFGYGDFDLQKVDSYGELLIPNYRKKTENLPAMLDVAKPFTEVFIEMLEQGSLLVTSNHPTLASPILTTRVMIEALQERIPDIQDRIYITYGMLPTMFAYDLGGFQVSPVGLAAGLGNVAVTAAVSDSNMQPHLKSWQSLHRDLYKSNIASKLAEPGNIVVTALNGQRDIVLGEARRKIHQPEGGLDVFTQAGVHLVNFAVYDRLLESPQSLVSPVEMYINPRFYPANVKSLEQSNEWQKIMLQGTFDGTVYYSEGVSEMARRISSRASEIGKLMGMGKP